MGIVPLFLDILDGDQSLEISLVIDQGELLDAMLLQDLLGSFERRPDGRRHQPSGSHIVRDGTRIFGGKADIAIGEDAHQLGALGDRYTGDVIVCHERLGVAERRRRRQGDGIHDHARFATLDFVYLSDLFLDGAIAMDDAEASLPSQGDGHPGIGDGVHRRREDGDGQTNARREHCGDVHRIGQDLRIAGHEQHVIKGERLGKSRVRE